ncbi:MAG: hypothetical protein U9N72_06680, partial [Bacteroidota bacterium]|nr:hypothetical protein [Bacteroidota bacterium]
MRYIRFLLIPFFFCLVTNTVFSQNAGSDQSVCGLTTTLAADDPSPNSGQWSVVGTPPGTVTFADNTLYNTAVTVGSYGFYTFRWTVDGVGSDDVDITFNPDNTITLSSEAGTDNQEVCINTAITPITYTTTGATGATFSGLPTGVSGSWSADQVTISGIPTASGTFDYTVTLTGGCGDITATGSIAVNPDNTITLSSAAGTDNQEVCINTAITDITYTTTGATGATFSGLPTGVSGSWSADQVTISGIPTASGTFDYTVTLTGGCGDITATGSIAVNPDNTITLSSAAGTDNQEVCINTAITDITYTTTGATGATFSGLPTGVSGSWSADQV